MAAGQVLNRRSSNIPERYPPKGTPFRLSAHTDALGPDNRVTDGTEYWRVSVSNPDLLILARSGGHLSRVRAGVRECSFTIIPNPR